MSETYDLGGEGGNSFPFDTIGDKVRGRILSMEKVNQTDMQTGETKTFDNGQPMTMWRVALQTTLSDDAADDGLRSIYLKGSKKPESKSSYAAVLAAVKAATGATQITAGAEVELEYVGDGAAKGRGYSPPKQYEAQYWPPSVDLAPEKPSQPAQVVQQALATVAAQQSAQPASGGAVTPIYGDKATATIWADEQVAAMRAAGVDVEQFRLN